ncbi:hypothetical protein TGAM01_v201963 [Trichoderma gamsii]|uniref:Saccharopine dehydrogenase NADP binding domain-containing protein n=1 Tax=Trichoderma gamsii TaxID=398673 RepID=A0A2P4ZX25_9HYPO|nr:hypothetical protein TGAM01_v201963 [Trichoderma gamsii]PON28855.1 hypothetical protein TGAM01_v201963 [Trichoderma gamsii]
MANLIIYGATGYTGRLASEFAKSDNLQFTVAGKSESKLKALAASLGVEYRIFALGDPKVVDAALQGARVLLNCSGPFLHTAEPLIEACIRNGVHYLDIAAELDSYELSEKKHEEAKKANVMLLPGCGGSVAMLGCLTNYMIEGVANPISIDIALHVAGPMSRGSAISAAENLTSKCLKRLDGKLVDQDSGQTIYFDFNDGRGSVSCFPATLPDVITIWRSTNIPNIRTFVHVAGDAFPTENLNSLAEGPTAKQRESNPYHVAATVTGSDGATTRAVLHTVNGYTFTPLASVEAARRVLMGEVKAGFQTPSRLFGYRFVEAIAGSTFRDL